MQCPRRRCKAFCSLLLIEQQTIHLHRDRFGDIDQRNLSSRTGQNSFAETHGVGIAADERRQLGTTLPPTAGGDRRRLREAARLVCFGRFRFVWPSCYGASHPICGALACTRERDTAKRESDGSTGDLKIWRRILSELAHSCPRCACETFARMCARAPHLGW
eukprot:5865355-Prymnesium_polylepis.1